VVAPAMVEVVLDVILSIVQLVICMLVVTLAFSIAAVMFFALCMRFTMSGESLDDEYASNRVLHAIWTRWA